MPMDHGSPNAAANDTAGAAAGHGAGSVLGDAREASQAHRPMPSAISQRYLRVADRYFFPDRTLAFIDDGARLRVRTENREVLRTAAAIAQARGWRVIEVRGTEAFRRGMWREATLRGIEVRGYAPTQVERYEMQREPLSRPGGRDATTGHEDAIASTGPGGLSGQGRSEGSPDDASAATKPGLSLEGTLVAAAAAPYRFAPANGMSFHVTLRTEAGDRTVWGADLERAIAASASRARIGDEVVLTRLDTAQADARGVGRAGNGTSGPEGKRYARRARWQVETLDHHRAMAGRASQARSGDPLARGRSAPPSDRSSAAASLQLAQQYARRVTPDDASRQRLVQLIRERLDEALAQGRTIQLPQRRMPSAQVPAQFGLGSHVRDRGDRGHERV